MILTAKAGLRGALVNLDTGAPVRWARWASIPDDGTTGSYEAYRCDPAEAKRQRLPLRELLYRSTARLRWLPGTCLSVTSPAPVQAPAPAAFSPVPQRLDVRPGVRVLPRGDRPCQHYGCIRYAEWAVATERPLPAVLGSNGRQYTAAQTIAVRWFCPWHFDWPQLLHPDGSTSPIEVRARPD